MVDFEKIERLAENVISNLHNAEVGELIFMHHVIVSTIQLLSDLNEPSVLRVCDNLEQSIFNEISRRVNDGRISFANPDILQTQIMEYYEKSATDSELSKALKHELLDTYLKQAKRRKGVKKEDILKKENDAFLKRYQKAFNIKKSLKIPSPTDIINGKSPPDVPNN